jgi:Holliday junction resolvase
LAVKATEKLMERGFKVCMLLEPNFVDLIAINNKEMQFIEVKSGKKWKFTRNEELVRKLCNVYGINYFVFNGEFHKLSG